MTSANRQSYEILLTIPLDNPGPFLRRFYFVEVSWITLLHQFVTALLLAGYLANTLSDDFTPVERMARFFLSASSLIFLLPLREMIRRALYRRLGADDVRFAFFPGKLIPFTIAHRFVVGVRQLTQISMSPFLIIISLLFLGALLLPSMTSLFAGSVLLVSIGCIGDIAPMNALWKYRSRDLYAFDDADERVRYVCAGNLE